MGMERGIIYFFCSIILYIIKINEFLRCSTFSFDLQDPKLRYGHDLVLNHLRSQLTPYQLGFNQAAVIYLPFVNAK